MQIVNGAPHLILNYDPLLEPLVAMSFIDLVEVMIVCMLSLGEP